MSALSQGAWLLAPAATLLLALLALMPLGAQVLARGVVFIDLAVAQAAAAAVLLAGALADELMHGLPLLTQAAACTGALLAALLVAWVARRWPAQREALIGLLYVLFACVALLAARLGPHGREQLTALLAADLLWAGWGQAAGLAACAAVVWALRGRLRRDALFYPVFALAASVAVPALGLFLVFVLLIAPALWERAGLGRALSLLLAAAAGVAGLGASWWFDAPSGACVAAALAVMGLLALLRAGRLRA